MSATEPTSRPSRQAGDPSVAPSKACGVLVVSGGINDAYTFQNPHKRITFEIPYLHDHKWARSADEVLWRRSKLGLHLSATERAAVATWCATHWPGPAASTTASRATEPAWN